MINCKKKKVSSTRKLFEIMYDNMPTSESYNHLNIIITDLVVNLENEEKYEINSKNNSG